MRARRILILISALAVWWVCSWIAARALIVDNSMLIKSDVIVVMSGSAAFRERTHAAAELFHQGIAPLILLTNDGQQGGWDDKRGVNPYTFELAEDELVRQGVPRSNIQVLRQVTTSTFDEVMALDNLLGQTHFKSIIVVTSGYHSRRTRWTFQRVFKDGPPTIAIFGVPPGQETPTPATWWWSPKGWRSVVEEYVKLVYYRMRYGS